MTTTNHPPGQAEAEAGRAGRLPSWRIGLAGGLVGIMCCVGPTVLALLGVVSAGTAFVWATDLYDNYAWWFRLAGLAVMVVLVWLALRRRNQCTVAGIRRIRWRLAGMLIVAIATYATLYALTTWLGSTADAPAHVSDREQVVEDYPDLNVRELRRLAREPRPVPNSALPPRHLDDEKFPAILVDRDRIVSGGQPPDRIPSLDEPQFASATTINWLADEEAVLVLQLAEHVRAYPVQVMIWHEIVNDWVGGIPVTVTYCPLCNSGIAFDSRVDGQVLDFGTSGALYQSALVMYDRQTESLWTHFDGRAVVGDLVGMQLSMLPLSTVSWRDFTAAHPDAPVLTRDTGYTRSYGENPYIGYDQADKPLTGFFTGDADKRLPPMTRVVGVHVQGASSRAFPLAVVTEDLASRGVITTQVGGRPVTLWYTPGTASSLHRRNIADGDDVGATGVFYTDHEAGSLHFTRDGDRFVDQQTGSTWNVLGEAIAGPLAGQRLAPATHVDTFWFAWSAYRPDTALIQS